MGIFNRYTLGASLCLLSCGETAPATPTRHAHSAVPSPESVQTALTGTVPSGDVSFAANEVMTRPDAPQSTSQEMADAATSAWQQQQPVAEVRTSFNELEFDGHSYVARFILARALNPGLPHDLRLNQRRIAVAYDIS